MTNKQKLFIKYYTDVSNYKTFSNGTQSAILAGYKEKSARFTASHLLENRQIKEEIDNTIQQRIRTSNISKEDYIGILQAQRDKCKSESVKARYDELIGRATGHLKETQVTATAIFNKEDIKKDRAELEALSKRREGIT